MALPPLLALPVLGWWPASASPTPTATRTARPAAAANLITTGSFTDTFAGSSDTDPLYGLNVGLGSRQTGTAGVVPYTRLSGVWYHAAPPRPWFVQVNNGGHPNQLLFTSGTSAVLLDAPLTADATGHYTVSTTVDPDVGSSTGGDWASLILSRSRHSDGYVQNGDVDIGLAVRSNGGLSLYGAGTQLWTGSVPCRRSRNSQL